MKVREAIEQGGPGWQDRLAPAVQALRAGVPAVVPFHWALEFPEVFERDNPGFDAIVGNPPFAGKNTTSAVNTDHYLDWLQTLHEGAHGNSDIVAHFFRRGYWLLRDGGCLGLLATNTIRQGDTRATGLRPIRQADGTIYTARRRYKWPGEAAVVVSVVHISKGNLPGPYLLDGRHVRLITAFLFHDGGEDDPRPLSANANKSFIGTYVLGMGFTFDDSDKKKIANPISLMHELIKKNPRNAERIFPYIGGEELNDSPTHIHHRYVINFEDLPKERDPDLPRWDDSSKEQRREMLRNGSVPADYPNPVASDWPDLIQIVERIKGTRAAHSTAPWWQFERRRPELYAAITGMEKVLVRSQVSAHHAMVFLANSFVFDQRLVVFRLRTFSGFAAMQSNVHEFWSRFFGATLEDRMTYTPSDCFETFPFPNDWEGHAALEAAGRAYYEFRAGLMVQRSEGLTKIYNRFHDPEERSNAIGELRRLHDAMDRAVLDAYGWSDIQPTCEFELEWEVDEAENGRRRRKPWRYRWPEPVRDEVLARLLALNAQRAEEERLALGDR